MRGRFLKQESRMETDKHKEDPRLSGAYIRSLVKHLTSSRTKDPMNTEDPESIHGDGLLGHQNLTKIAECYAETPPSQPPHQPQQHKKQVRRRLHTTRPYQERLLNMAEARREIVTALKFHRAAMKQANEQQQEEEEQQQSLMKPQPLQPSSHTRSLEDEGKLKSRRNPSSYASTSSSAPTTDLSNFVDNISYSTPSYPLQNPYPWPISPPLPPPVTENLDLSLPNQTLGLNLNLHEFSNLDTNLYHNSSNPSIYSASSSSSTSLPALSAVIEDVLYVTTPPEGPSLVTNVEESSILHEGDLGLHPAMDDEEIAEIRSIGEQHQMVWNDTMNLVTSAWWFKFSKSMEIVPEEKDEDNGFHPFDQVMEFPSWLNANESCLQQHMDDYCAGDYLGDPSLPCVDIGEIEGMDQDWLA